MNNKYSPDDYHDGQVVEVEVVRVKHYGALTVTTDGRRTKGLIHKSETADAFVDDPHNYFEEGDIVKARITDWDPAKRQMALSTTEFDIKPQINNGHSESKKLIKFKNKLKAKEKRKNKDSPKSKQIKKILKSDDFNNIVKYLNGKIGVLSQKAKKELAGIVNEHGIFNFTRSLENILPDFEVDYGIILANEIKEYLKSDTMLQYVISDHAVEQYTKRAEKYLDKTIDKEKEEVKENIEYMCYHGKVIIESEDIKYIKYGNWFLPCSKDENDNIEVWVVKSVLTWEMFAENMQEKADKYMEM